MRFAFPILPVVGRISVGKIFRLASSARSGGVGGERVPGGRRPFVFLTAPAKQQDTKPAQIGRVVVGAEDPILKRRDRTPTIEVRGDTDDYSQPPDVATAISVALSPLAARLPDGYRIEMAGNLEKATEANTALARVFPVMIVVMLIIIMLQVRSFPAMAMVFLTAPLGLAGAVPILLAFGQPFGFDAILGLIGLAGILMHNTLILIGQIHTNQAEGLNTYNAVVEATVQRARPVILTALAAVLAFIPLTISVFWGSMAYTLIGGTAAGTVLTLVFLPALYAIWFKIRPSEANRVANRALTGLRLSA